MKKWVVLLISVLIIGLIVFTLLKNKADIAAEARIVPIDSYPVSVVKVVKENISRQTTQIGQIVSNNDVQVVSEHSGKVISVMVKEGAYVAKGAPLVRLDDIVSQAQNMSAQANYQKAKKDWERYESLRKQDIISDSELEAARLNFKAAEANYVAAQKQYHNAVIVSPISGVVVSRPVNIGSMVNPGTVVANVVDMSLFKVEVNVGEQDVFRLKVGDPVTIQSDVYPEASFSGRIESISAKADVDHTYPVKILLPNNNRQYPLRSGMYGKVTFNFPSQFELTIPRTALVGSINTPQVYVVKGHKAVLRDIVVGATVGPKVIVLQGLNEGDTVVTSGQENLKDGIKVTIEK